MKLTYIQKHTIDRYPYKWPALVLHQLLNTCDHHVVSRQQHPFVCIISIIVILFYIIMIIDIFF